jgi:hypothetical protein
VHLRDGVETVRNVFKFDQGHVLVIVVAQYFDSLDGTELLEDVTQLLRFANLSTEGRHMEGLAGRVNGDGLKRGEAE